MSTCAARSYVARMRRVMTGGGAIVAITSISGFLADRTMAHTRHRRPVSRNSYAPPRASSVPSGFGSMQSRRAPPRHRCWPQPTGCPVIASASPRARRSAASAHPTKSRRRPSCCARSTGSPGRSSPPMAASRCTARSTRSVRHDRSSRLRLRRADPRDRDACVLGWQEEFLAHGSEPLTLSSGVRR